LAGCAVTRALRSAASQPDWCGGGDDDDEDEEEDEDDDDAMELVEVVTRTTAKQPMAQTAKRPKAQTSRSIQRKMTTQWTSQWTWLPTTSRCLSVAPRPPEGLSPDETREASTAKRQRLDPDATIDATAIEVAGIRISMTQCLIIAAAGVMVGALRWVMNGTRLGRGLRALAERPDVAGLMGVNAGALVRLVSLASGALAGASGVLIGLNYNAIQPYMGEVMMLKGFAVIILGGLGDIRGALVAGLVVGMLETLTAGYVASSWKDAVGFVLLVLTLWIRPSGLFGRLAVKRA
jgi:branched-subunit amino acid ABC-type transport system permease component